MILSLLQPRARPFERLVQIFFSGTRFIVASTHRNQAGVYYEQAAPVVLDDVQPAVLGAAFRKAFLECSFQARDLSTWKKSDWPSYRASGLTSIKAFEREYTAIQCCGLNPANVTVRASRLYPGDPEMELSISFNPMLDPDKVGGMLLRLAKA